MSGFGGITEDQLKEYRVIALEIERLWHAYDKICIRADRNRPRGYPGETIRHDPRPGNRQPALSFFDSFDDFMQVLENESYEILEKIDTKKRQLAAYDDILIGMGLTDIEYKYITRRYFDGQPHWRVARELHYTKDGADKVRKRALEKLKSSG